MSDLLSPRVLASFPEPIQAAGLVSVLAAEGIVGRSVGDFTSGFQAEAPGTVDVLVSDGDFAKATRIVEQYAQSDEPVDWSTVDVGDDSLITADEFVDEQGDRITTGMLPWILGGCLLLVLMLLVYMNNSL